MALANIQGPEIKGIVVLVPAAVEDNMELDVIAEGGHEALVKHTGIAQRHIAPEGLSVEGLFEKGLRELLGSLAWSKDSVDILLCVTQTSGISVPSVSNRLHGTLDLPQETLCYDINSGCSGYVYGLHTIASLLKSTGREGARAVLCCGDLSSRLIDRDDPATRPVFSDAVSLTAIELTARGDEWYFNLETNGKGHGAIYTEAMDNRQVMRLNGIDVFGYSLGMVPANVEKLLRYAGKDTGYPALYVFHQANKLINDAVRKKLGLSEAKAPSTLYRYGNTASASIPLTLGLHKHEAVGPVLLCGFGVGFSVASALLPFDHNTLFRCMEV